MVSSLWGSLDAHGALNQLVMSTCSAIKDRTSINSLAACTHQLDTFMLALFYEEFKLPNLKCSNPNQQSMHCTGEPWRPVYLPDQAVVAEHNFALSHRIPLCEERRARWLSHSPEEQLWWLFQGTCAFDAFAFGIYLVKSDFLLQTMYFSVRGFCCASPCPITGILVPRPQSRALKSCRTAGRIDRGALMLTRRRAFGLDPAGFSCWQAAFLLDDSWPAVRQGAASLDEACCLLSGKRIRSRRWSSESKRRAAMLLTFTWTDCVVVGPVR